MSYVIRTEAKGDVAFLAVTYGLDWRINIALVPNPGPRETYATIESAERTAARVAKADPSLPLTIVPLDLDAEVWCAEHGRACQYGCIR